MDEIEKRLRESTDACIRGFEAWVKASRSPETREPLMEAMHEVRKVVSRLEIEIAISERDRLGSRPIPIPPHRSQRKRGGEGVADETEFNNAGDYEADDAPAAQSGEGTAPRRHQGGRGRRQPHHRSTGNGNAGGNSTGNGNTATGGNGDSENS